MAAEPSQEAVDRIATGEQGTEEIGRDEAWFANVKRTFDEFQDISLVAARRSQVNFDTLNNNLQAQVEQRIRHAEELHRLSLQAMQNAIETANMVAKNATNTQQVVGANTASTSHGQDADSRRHADLNIDAQLNPVQQGAADTLTARAVSIDDASLKAIGAAIAAALTSALNPAKPAA